MRRCLILLVFLASVPLMRGCPSDGPTAPLCYAPDYPTQEEKEELLKNWHYTSSTSPTGGRVRR